MAIAMTRSQSVGPKIPRHAIRLTERERGKETREKKRSGNCWVETIHIRNGKLSSSLCHNFQSWAHVTCSCSMNLFGFVSYYKCNCWGIRLNLIIFRTSCPSTTSTISMCGKVNMMTFRAQTKATLRKLKNSKRKYAMDIIFYSNLNFRSLESSSVSLVLLVLSSFQDLIFN